MNWARDHNIVLGWAEVEKIARQRGDRDLQLALKKTRSNRASWADLRVVSMIMPYLSDHELYERLLADFDPCVDLHHATSAKAASFVGVGGGSESLHAYRIIEINGERLFEKVYRADSPSFQNILWFQNHLQDRLLSSNIRAPTIRMLSRSQRLAAVYYECIDIHPISNSAVLDRILEVSRTLRALGGDLARTDSSYYDSAPHHVTSWCARAYAANGLPEIATFIQQTEHKISKVQTQLSHGDLYKGNIGQNNVVIDWDECGLHPAGYDIARGLSFICLWDSLNELEEHIVSNFCDEMNEREFSDFLFSALFYSFVYYSLNKRGGDNFRYELYRRLSEWDSAGARSFHALSRS
ncbi:hypothetical protein B1C78_15550 [Thioalkalivibrio denitrificans]|uniref:Aminoglycoside phosphotransferase domain-containing protein n=1 Tax=Thioalkalivibrio denitrificans TaxID=108003 RepID=A0A1V3NAG5_9GAMM|nr:hypothetical protein B1C78_15550 [Thioalkalivibrio denitrificans]